MPGVTDSAAYVYASHFKVQIGGAEFQHVSNVSPLTFTFPPVPSEGGVNADYVVFQPGQPQYADINLSGPQHADTIGTLKGWVKQIVDGDEGNLRKNIVVELYPQAMDSPVCSFELHDAFPKSWNWNEGGFQAGQSGLITWSMVCSVTRVTVG